MFIDHLLVKQLSIPTLVFPAPLRFSNFDIKWQTFLQLPEDQFDIMTDNRLLKYFMTSKQLNRRQARWNKFLADFVFDIRYCPGVQGAKPDTSSRRHNHYKEGGGREPTFPTTHTTSRRC